MLTLPGVVIVDITVVLAIVVNTVSCSRQLSMGSAKSMQQPAGCLVNWFCKFSQNTHSRTAFVLKHYKPKLLACFAFS